MDACAGLCYLDPVDSEWWTVRTCYLVLLVSFGPCQACGEQQQATE